MLFRKAILLVHGFAGGSWDYGDLGNELQLNLNFDVFTFTLPGHDKSIISNVTKDDWIRAAEEQIEKLINYGYKNIYVVGHSMGGVIACHLAKKYKQVKKLVLAAPAFKYLSFNGEKIDLNSSIKSIKKTPELIKDYSLEVAISRAFKMSLSASLEFSKLVKEHHDDPKFITCPVLIIQGTKDLMAPVDSAKYVHKNIKSRINKLILIEGVTHDVFKSSRKEEIYKLVIDFFKEKYFGEINEEKQI
jgi:esterase/lipase